MVNITPLGYDIVTICFWTRAIYEIWQNERTNSKLYANRRTLSLASNVRDRQMTLFHHFSKKSLIERMAEFNNYIVG